MRNIYLILFCVTTIQAAAQIGRIESYHFLNVPNHPRLAALGGVNVSLTDSDVNLFQSNPALVGDSLVGWASLNYQFYLADVAHTSFAYAHEFKKVGLINMAVQHLNYGLITSYDASGAELGDFKSGETALTMGKSHQIGNYRIGMNVKAVFSSIAGFRSSAMAFDFGGIFIHPKKEWKIGMAFKNIGIVFSDYNGTSNARLPFDVQIGTTFQPEHMPVRFSFTAFHLAQGDVTYFNPDDNGEKPGAIDRLFRHFNFGAELLLHQHVNIRLGYDYLMRKELGLEERSGGAGISFGFNIFVKSFEFAFSRSGYVIGTGATTMSLSTNIGGAFKRKEK